MVPVEELVLGHDVALRANAANVDSPLAFVVAPIAGSIAGVGVAQTQGLRLTGRAAPARRSGGW